MNASSEGNSGRAASSKRRPGAAWRARTGVSSRPTARRREGGGRPAEARDRVAVRADIPKRPTASCSSAPSPMHRIAISAASVRSAGVGAVEPEPDALEQSHRGRQTSSELVPLRRSQRRQPDAAEAGPTSQISKRRGQGGRERGRNEGRKEGFSAFPSSLRMAMTSRPGDGGEGGGVPGGGWGDLRAGVKVGEDAHRPHGLGHPQIGGARLPMDPPADRSPTRPERGDTPGGWCTHIPGGRHGTRP